MKTLHILYKWVLVCKSEESQADFVRSHGTVKVRVRIHVELHSESLNDWCMFENHISFKLFTLGVKD